METTFYLYTIFVMPVCVASGSVSLSAYFVSRRRSFLFAAAMLLFYFLDLALIFQYEYLGQNVEYSINQFYTIDHPHPQGSKKGKEKASVPTWGRRLDNRIYSPMSLVALP